MIGGGIRTGLLSLRRRLLLALGIAVLATALVIANPAGAQVDQIPTCFGAPATILGTQGPDVGVGTAGPDVIVLLGGNDTVSAGAGDDRVCGGQGNDTISLGSGEDFAI